MEFENVQKFTNLERPTVKVPLQNILALIVKTFERVSKKFENIFGQMSETNSHTWVSFFNSEFQIKQARLFIKLIEMTSPESWDRNSNKLWLSKATLDLSALIRIR